MLRRGVSKPRRHHRLGLRRKEETSALIVEEKRLDPESIADSQQFPFAPVIEEKGKLTTQAIDKGEAVLLVEMDDHFRVAAGAEHVAQEDQLFAQAFEIVNLSVTNEDDIPVFRIERLRPRRQVDDGEARVPQGDRDFGIQEDAAAIRPSMAHRIDGPLQGRFGKGMACRSHDPAHIGSNPP